MSSHNGTCGCGKIHYQVNTQIKRVINCNCDLCRAVNGGAFSTYAVVQLDDVRIVKGRAYLKSFKSSANTAKHFCCNCGTPVYNLSDNFLNVCMIHFGTLTDCLDLVPMSNVYCDTELAWLGELDAMIKLPGGRIAPRRKGVMMQVV